MNSLEAIECQRLEIQGPLDAAKTRVERNKLGQFATPPALALDILSFAKALLPRNAKIRFLDPAFGTGSFYSALLRTFPTSRIQSATAYEIDAHYGSKAQDLWKKHKLKLELTDFTRACPPTKSAKCNLLICNPPYVRHHHLATDEKLRLQQEGVKSSGVQLNGLAGLYCHFLCLSHSWMGANGIAGWLIPSEFMDVNYGNQIKKYLLNRVTLLRIHRFDPNDVQFEDALVSSAVVWFQNSPPPENHSIEFSYGGSLSHPKILKKIPSNVLYQTAKWTRYPLMAAKPQADNTYFKISDLFTVKRGIATGANNFFIVTEEQAAHYDLPRKFLQPILPSPRHLQADEVLADPAGFPLIGKKLFLVSCPLPESEVKSKYPALWNYFNKGTEAKVHLKYLSAHRSPWYLQEVRSAAPYVCTYMGRSDSDGKSPFRFILNHSNAIAANVYLMLYPKPSLEEVLRDNPILRRKLWEALNLIPAETLIGEGRVYGGGLYKIEPKELANATIPQIAHEDLGIEVQPELWNRDFLLREHGRHYHHRIPPVEKLRPIARCHP